MTSVICLFSEIKVILLKRRHSAGGLALFAAAMADYHHHQNKRSRNAFSAIPEEIFSPSGLHVLIVDDDTLLLAGLEKILRQCDYNVTTSTSVSQAISLVMENKSSFDLVMSEVYFPGEDGFKILEVVGVGLGLPVIMMSMNGETDVVMRGITRGACNYLIKPIRMEEVRNLWQHVIRRHGRQYDNLVKLKDGHGDSSSNGRVADSPEWTAFKDVKQGGEVIKDISGLKEARVNWTLELHQQFLNAINESGPNKVIPKRILEIMNVPGLTRDNVASHLQKYRLYLKRLCGIIPEPCPVASFRATRDEKSGGTMQIRPGGKTSAVSPLSSSGSSSGLKELPLSLELDGRNLDQATLESLEQFRSHEHEQKLAAANTGQVLPELVVAAAPAPIHVDEGSEGGPEVHGMRPSFHLRWLRRNLQGGGGHKASQVDDLAARSFKLNFVEDLHNTKTPPKTVDLPTHQPQLQNPSPTTEILEKDDAYHHEEAWPMAEYDKIYEDLLFNIFLEEDIGFPNHQINFRSFPFVASDVSEEYGATVNADNFNCQPSPE